MPPSLVAVSRARPRLRSLAALGVALALGACSTLVGASQKAPDIFDLSVPARFTGIKGRTGAQLLVPQPTAIDALGTARLLVRQAGGQLSYYPNVSWSDELPSLIQTKLVRAFENSGRAKAVGRPGESLAIDYQVIVDIRAFELDVSGARTAHVELGVKLLDDRTGKVRATRVIDARAPAPSDQAAAVVQALDQAAGEAFTELVLWTAKTI